MAIVGERVPLEQTCSPAWPPLSASALPAGLEAWQRDRVPVVLARVVTIDDPGAAASQPVLAVNEDGEVAGSALAPGELVDTVVAEALDVLRRGRPRLVSFGYSADQAYSLGLTCGGTLHVYLEPLAW